MTDRTIGMHGVSASGALPVFLLTGDLKDVEIHHLESRQPLFFSNVKITAKGPLRASIAAEVKLANSIMNVTVCAASQMLYYDSQGI